MDIKNYLLILERRKWIILIAVIVTELVVIALTLRMAPAYMATATIRIATASASSSSSDYMFADRLITTYINIATSRPILNELQKQLNINYDPSISVAQITNTELIKISVEDENPNLAMQAANTLSSILISQSGEFYTGTGKTPADILKEEIDKAASDLEQLRKSYLDRLAQKPNDTVGNQAVAKAVDSEQQLYYSLLSQYQQLRVREAIQANLVSIVERAGLPTSPSKPNKTLNSILGFMVGLIGGIGLAFLFDIFDTTLFTSNDICEVTDLRLVGGIPIYRKGDPKGFHLDGKSPYSEAFFRLRTNLFALMPNSTKRTLMVASSMQNEGKTTIASCLAVALSQSKKRVILVDCDLRLPSVHKKFNLPNKFGMSDYLEGKMRLEEIIQATCFEGLHVISGGQTRNNTTLLFDSVMMNNLIANLLTTYDLIVFDSPAVQAVTDASIIAPLVDGVILVAKLGLIRKELLAATLEQMENVKASMIGLVINGSKHNNHYYYYNRKLER